MFKKKLSGIFVLMLMTFTLGCFCLSSNKKVEPAPGHQVTQTAESFIVSAETVDFSSYSLELALPTPDEYGDCYNEYGYPEEMYKIQSAQDLAYLAYVVNNDLTLDYNSYILTQDIDLSSGFWTPIGTSAHPFTGYFFGEFHKISNITITDDTLAGSDYAGLFGYMNGRIYDLVIDGNFIVRTTSELTHIGALAGSVGTYDIDAEYADLNYCVFNCYDKTTKTYIFGESGNTTVVTEGYSIGGGSGAIFRGGSSDGRTAEFTTEEEILSTITVSPTESLFLDDYTEIINVDPFEDENGVIHTPSKINIMIGDYTPTLLPGQRNRIRTWASSSMYGSLPYYTAAYSLREDFIDSQLSSAGYTYYACSYVICKGYRARFPSTTIENGLVGSVTFEKQEDIKVLLKYGYEEQGSRDVTISVQYDETIPEVFGRLLGWTDEEIWTEVRRYSSSGYLHDSTLTNHPYLRRAGYIFGEGMFLNQPYKYMGEYWNEENAWLAPKFDALLGYDDTNFASMIRLTSNFDNGYLEPDENGVYVFYPTLTKAVYPPNNSYPPHKDIALNLKLVQDSSSLLNDIGKDTATVEIVSNEDVVLEKNENAAYYNSTSHCINNVLTGSITFKVTLDKGYRIDNHIETKSLGLGYGATASSDIASGLYLGFTNYTGTGKNYTDNANNDDYSPVNAVMTEEILADGRACYTITLNNVVGTGDITLVVSKYYTDLVVLQDETSLKTSVPAINNETVTVEMVQNGTYSGLEHRVNDIAKGTTVFKVTLKRGFTLDIANMQYQNGGFNLDYGSYAPNGITSGIYKGVEGWGVSIESQETSAGDMCYTITLSDIAQSGVLTLVVSRTAYKMDITPVVNSLEGTLEFGTVSTQVDEETSLSTSTITVNESGSATDKLSYILTVVGDGINLELDEENNKIYLVYTLSSYTLSLTVTNGAILTAQTNDSAFAIDSKTDEIASSGYYKTWNWNFTPLAVQAGRLEPVIGKLKSKVNVIWKYGDEVLDLSDSTIAERFKNLVITINETDIFSTNFVSFNGVEDTFKIDGALRYYSVVSLQAGVTISPVVISNPPSISLTGQFITTIYNGNDESSMIDITINLRDAYYSTENTQVNYENVAKSYKGLFTETISYYKDSACTQEQSAMGGRYPRGTYVKYEYVLTDLGRAILNWTKNSAGNDLGIYNSLTGGYYYEKNVIISDNIDENFNRIVICQQGTATMQLRVYFEFVKPSLQVTKLQIESTSEVIENTNGITNFTSQLTFGIDNDKATANAGQITQNEITLTPLDTLGSINIPFQYYLLGWYLVDGDTKVAITSDYNGLYTDENAFTTILNKGKTRTTKDIVIGNFYALVENRKVNVNVNLDSASEGGNFYHNGTWSTTSSISNFEQIAFGQNFSLSATTYRKLGSKLLNYTYSGRAINLTGDSLTEKEWSSLYSSSGSTGAYYNTWDSFSSSTNELKNITLIANWKKIQYIFKIDNIETIEVEFGAQLEFVSSGNKDGKAQYGIQGQSGSYVYGSGLNGYIATGCTISQATPFTGQPYEIFEAEKFKAIVSEDYYFAQNTSEPISITTLRTPATYKFYVQTSGYYAVDWTGENTSNGGKDDGGVYVIVTYNSKPAITEGSFLIDGLTVTRDGFVLNGWNGLTINSEGAFIGLADGSISPIWARSGDIGVSISSTWTDDANSILKEVKEGENLADLATGDSYLQVYNRNAHEILNSSLSGSLASELALSVGSTSGNGYKVSDYGFYVYLYINGAWQKYNTINAASVNPIGETPDTSVFDYIVTQKVGVYKAVAFLEITDLVSGEKINIGESQGKTYQVKANSLIVADISIQSIYSTTQGFYPTEDSTFGTTGILYLWNGAVNTYKITYIPTTGADGAFSITGEIVGENYKAGETVNIKAESADSFIWTILDKLNEWGQYIFLDESYRDENLFDYNNLFENIVLPEKTIKFDANNVLLPVTILKAEATLDLFNTSSFYTGSTPVAKGQTRFYSEGQGYITISYEQIRLKEKESYEYKTYSDSADFEVVGFKVEYEGEDITENYNWKLAEGSSFTLLNHEDAQKYEFSVQYLTATEGELNVLTSEKDYAVSLNLIAKLNGENITLPTQAPFYYYTDNGLLFSFAGVGSKTINIFVNQENTDYANLTFTVTAIDDADEFKFLSWIESANVDEKIYNDESSAFDEYSLNKNTAINTAGTYYAIYSNVTKVYICHNDIATNVEDNLATIKYLSSGDSLNIGTISQDESLKYVVLKYKGLTSDSDTLSKVQVTNTASGENISSTIAVNGVYGKRILYATWELVNYTFEPEPPIELNFIAIATEFDLTAQGLDTIYKLLGEGDRTKATAFRLTKGEYTFSSEGVNPTMIMKDEYGFFSALLSGEWALEATYSFSNDITLDNPYKDENRSSITKTYSIVLNVAKVQLGIGYSGENLTYTGLDQKSNIELDLYCDGIKQTTDSLDHSGDYVYEIREAVTNETVTEIKNAGIYLIKALPTEAYENVIEFVNPSNNVTITVNKKAIVLGDVHLEKVLGASETSATLTKVYEGVNGERVQILFERELGEDVGTYVLSNPVIIGDENKLNYSLDSTNFVGELEIVAPEDGTLYANLLNGQLDIIYDGSAVNQSELNFAFKETSDDGKNIFTITLNHNGQQNTVDIEIYYMTAGERTDLPSSVTGVTLAISGDKNVGSKPIALSYDGKDATTASQEQQICVNIIQKGLTIVSVTKTFDGTTSFEGATISLSGIVDTDQNKVSLNGSFGAVIGEATLKNLSLSGEESGNYYIVNTDATGSISKKTIASTDVTVTFALNGDKHYGEVKATKEFLLASGSLTFTLNESVGIENASLELFTVSSITFDAGQTSSSNNFKAGERTVKFVLVSDYFSGLDTEGYTVTFTIKKKSLDLSGLTITKDYDGTTTLPTTLPSLSSFIEEGDNVLIASGQFTSADVGSTTTTITLSGIDSENYSVSAYPVGRINALSLTIILDSTSNIPASGFIDGENAGNISVKAESVTIGYPIESVEQTMAELDSVLPTKLGYVAYWHYTEGDYSKVTESNLNAVIQEIASGGGKTLYAMWDIDFVTLSIRYDTSLAELTCEGTSISTFTYQKQYYSDFEFTLTAKPGYKITTLNVTAGNYDKNKSSFSGKGTRTIAGNVAKIRENVEIEVIIEKIQVTFNFDVNIPELTKRTDTNANTKTLNLLDLSSLTDSSLPQFAVTAGTYHQNGFSYLSGEEERTTAGKDLQTVLLDGLELASLGDINSDTSINLKVLWIGEEYLLKFDKNTTETTTPEQVEDISVVFGQALEQPLPSITLPGRTSKWICADGKEYGQGVIFQSVGTFDETEGKYVYTLTAQWGGNTYTLTFDIPSQIKVTLSNGDQVTSEDSFDVQYGGDEKTFKVIPNDGYKFGYDNTFAGEVEFNQTTGFLTIKNLTDNTTLKLIAVANDNKLTLALTHSIFVSAIVDEEIVEIENDSLTVKTGKVVKITLKAEQGYVFDGNSTVLPSNGEIANKTISADTISFEWSGFTRDATLTVKSSPRKNQVGFGNLTDLFTNLTTDSGIIVLNGTGKAEVETEKVLKLEGTLKYGLGKVELQDIEGLEITQNTSWSASAKAFVWECEISGINKDIAIASENFTTKNRTFDFVLSLKEGQLALGNIPQNLSEQTISFGNKLSLGVNVTASTYHFDHWEIDGQEIEVVEEEGVTSYVINASTKPLLAGYSPDDKIKVSAVLIKYETVVNFLSDANGTINFECDDIEGSVSGDSQGYKLPVNSELALTLIPNAGYLFGKEGEVFHGTLKINGTTIDIENDSRLQTEVDGNGNLVIKLTVFSDLEKIEVNFEAKKFDISVVAKTLINFIESTQPTDDGGLIYLCDEEGNLLGDEYYIASDAGYADGGKGYDFKVATQTDGKLYFIAVPKSGWNNTTEVVNAKIVSFVKNGKTIYQISEIKEGAVVTSKFSAKTNRIDIQFVLDNQTAVKVVDAGKINVTTISNLIQVSSNGTYSVSVDAITSSSISIDLFSNPAYFLTADSSGKAKYKFVANSDSFDSDSITAGMIEEREIVLTGYNNYASMTIDNINCGGTLYIHVTPKTFNIRFFVLDGNNNVIVENSGVTVAYGQTFSLTGLSEENRNIIFQEREKYTLAGYFTKQLGQGKQYINASGSTVELWNETGYEFNGSAYVPQENYNPETNTFTLYACWMYKKASITIEFVPTEFATNLGSLSISDLITNRQNVNLWIGTNNWYGEVTNGTLLKFKAFEIEGYTFDKWVVSFDGGAGEEIKTTTFEMNFVQGAYTLTAIYRPIYNLTVRSQVSGLEEGGSTYILQDGNVLTGGSFDSTKPLTVIAKADDGYNFLYWLDITNGNKLYGMQDGDVYVLSYEPRVTPLKLKAIFDGKDVNVSFDYSEVGNIHTVFYVKVGSTLVADKSSFTAKVGDEISIKVIKKNGFGIEMQGGEFIVQDQGNNQYILTYKIKVEDLTLNGEDYSLSLKMIANREKIKLSFSSSVEDAISQAEIADAGQLMYIDKNESEHQISKEGDFEIIYGDLVKLKVQAFKNYAIASIKINATTVCCDDYIENEYLVIDQQFVDNFFASNMKIEIVFKRLNWTDEEVVASELKGEGTKSKPYLISDAGELAFMVQAIANGLENNGVKYSEAEYKLTADIDLDGRFFTPIGTAENPFNGVFDFGKFQITGVTHSQAYTQPQTSYEGVFWHLGTNAKIIKDVSIFYIIIASITGGVAILFGGFIAIVIVRRKRRHELSTLGD